MKDRLKYVIDSRYFDGTCLTSMSDGFRNDYGGGDNRRTAHKGE